MDTSLHSLENLFLQLGLDSSSAAMDEFIKQHKLEPEHPMEQAEFWTASQKAFIQECLSEDSDWAEVVDQLNVLLHE
jgi:hypothetical protein